MVAMAVASRILVGEFLSPIVEEPAEEFADEDAGGHGHGPH